jgi:L-iditol 2-dehydrogenase
MVGICGSDMHYYDSGGIGSESVEYPFVIGHECAATVAEVGPEVTEVKVGDRVAVEPGIICHDCDQCRQGRENTCRNMKFLGCPGQMAGCLSEYIVMPEECCFPVGKDITWESAVLCEPLAIAIYACHGAALPKNSTVAILGAGPIGLSCMVSTQADNAGGIYVTEKVRERVEIAKSAGATWVGNPDEQDVVGEILAQNPCGVDAVFECAGEQETLDHALEIVKPGGKVMIIGIPRIDRVSFVADAMRRNEVTIVNVRRQNKCTQTAIDLVTSGKLKLDFMATHKFKIEQSQEAFDMLSNYRDGVVKAMIEF